MPSSCSTLPLQQIKRALQLPNVPGHNMGIYLGGLHVRVTEQFLQNPDVYPVFQHIRGETVSQRVATYPLTNPSLRGSAFHGFLQH